MVGPGWDFYLNETGGGAESLSDASGILPRAAMKIFEAVGKQEKLRSAASVRVACLEIYNERIMDILAPGKPELNFMGGRGAPSVKDLSWTDVASPRAVLECIRVSS